MPDLVISIGALTESKTYTQGQVNRFLAVYREIYKSDDPLAPQMTNEEIFHKFAEGIFKGIRNNILNQEEIERIKTARTATLDF